MTRTQLARRAYDRACRALEAARDAGTISPDEAPKELRAADCKTPDDWARWARERREYEDPFGYERSRY